MNKTKDDNNINNKDDINNKHNKDNIQNNNNSNDMDNTIKNKDILKEDNIINDIDNINIKDKIKEDIKEMDNNKNKENNKDNIDENNTIKDNDNIIINDNGNTYKNKSCNIDNIKSLYILQQLFNYIEDINFPFILFNYSKLYQQKLDLTKDKYKQKYQEKTEMENSDILRIDSPLFKQKISNNTIYIFLDDSYYYSIYKDEYNKIINEQKKIIHQYI